MTRENARRLRRLEAHVAGIGPGCPVCRLKGDVQMIDDHDYAALPATCPACGLEVAGRARVEVHVVGADLSLIVGRSLASPPAP